MFFIHFVVLLFETFCRITSAFSKQIGISLSLDKVIEWFVALLNKFEPKPPKTTLNT